MSAVRGAAEALQRLASEGGGEDGPAASALLARLAAAVPGSRSNAVRALEAIEQLVVRTTTATKVRRCKKWLLEADSQQQSVRDALALLRLHAGASLLHVLRVALPHQRQHGNVLICLVDCPLCHEGCSKAC